MNDVFIFCEDIEREILRKSPEDDHLEDHYHGQYSSSENRRSVASENKTGNLNFSRKQADSR